MGIVTIPVDATTSHSGMLLPGNRIDLLLTFSDSSSGVNLQKTITVLQSVEVFAVDNRVYGIDKGGDAQAKNITLLVAPEQGKAVTLAGKVGTLSTMMRARGGADEKGQTEISEEFLTSSFLGSNRNAPSVMDLREDAAEEEGAQMNSQIAAVDPPLNVDEQPTVSQLLDLELNRQVSADPGGSGPVVGTPVIANANTWTMEIYEGEALRVESITIADSAEKKSEQPSGKWSMWDLLKSN
jgi:pilus assembly protein CpaB